MKRASQRERPPPLQIQKPEDQNGRANAIAGHPYPQQLYRQPAIYQTRSPDVINTDPHDFMAMVQKLTGQARSHGILSPLAKRPCLPSTSSNAAVSSSADNHSHSHGHGCAPAEIGRAEMEAAGLRGAVSNSYNLISQVQNMQSKEQLGFAASNAASSASASASASASFSFSSASAEPGRARKVNLGLGLQQKEHASWSQAVGALLSPSNFVLSPSLLPSPSTFLKDFPFLKPPFPSSSALSTTDAVLPPSPKLSMEAGRLYDSLRTPKLELPGHEFGSKLEESLMRSPTLGFLSSRSNPAGMEAAEGGDHHHHHHHHLQRSPIGFPNYYSPGPLTRYLTDLPVLSPAGAYKWIENDPSPLPQSSRSHGLPPRPPSQYRSDA